MKKNAILNFFCDPCNMKTGMLSFHKDQDSLTSERKNTPFPEPSSKNVKDTG